ncbi:hypothetical protein SAY87_021787 [Trapa incisa]|uniref:Sugar transporter SWEET1 n=1 Tax=Trapa incisa TaxID=236973 RepID=A0AAN7PSC1_9MYRT|nr:hypothetical protein SAY87_021787 [Trapa incisa]
MAAHHAITLAFAFGLMGNIIGFITFLAPLPTFYHIYKRRSARGFQSIPYAVSLMSATILLYYGSLKKDMLLISINSFGCFISMAYVGSYLAYATRNGRWLTVKLVLGMNVLGFGAIFLSTTLVGHKLSPKTQIEALGWICMVFSICVFAAPLGIMRKVIRTRNVEYMPFSLSAFLTVGAVVWFCYGFFRRDFFIAVRSNFSSQTTIGNSLGLGDNIFFILQVPNILGFLLGMIQMGLYFFYRNSRASVYRDAGLETVAGNDKLSEQGEQVIEVVSLREILQAALNPSVLEEISTGVHAGDVSITILEMDEAEAGAVGKERVSEEVTTTGGELSISIQVVADTLAVAAPNNAEPPGVTEQIIDTNLDSGRVEEVTANTNLHGGEVSVSIKVVAGLSTEAAGTEAEVDKAAEKKGGVAAVSEKWLEAGEES